MDQRLKNAGPLVVWGFLGAFVLPGITLLGLGAPREHIVAIYGFNLFGLALFVSACWVVHTNARKRWRTVSYTLHGAMQLSCMLWLFGLQP